MSSKVFTLFSLIVLSGLATSCEKRVSITARLALRMSVLKKAGASGHFETKALYTLTAGTDTAFNLPRDYPVVVQLKLGTARLGGVKVTPRFAPARGLDVSADGRSATWTTQLIVNGLPPKIETTLKAHVSEGPIKAPCGGKVPLLITTSYSIHPKSDDWKVESKTGIARSPDGARAFLDCAPSDKGRAVTP